MVRPDFNTLEYWAASLFVDFPNDNIPILYNTDDSSWRIWGNQLILADSFSEADAPGTDTFASWFPWAMAVTYAMANNGN